MGNIPAKNEVILITEFIHFIEASENYEFEFFRNLPIFKGGEDIYQNSELKGKVIIIAKNDENGNNDGDDDGRHYLTYELEGNRLHVYGKVFTQCGPNNYAYFYEKRTDDRQKSKESLQKRCND